MSIFSNSYNHNNKVSIASSVEILGNTVKVYAKRWEQNGHSRIYFKLYWADGSNQTNAGYFCLNSMEFVSAGLKGSARWNAQKAAEEAVEILSPKPAAIKVECQSSLMRRAWQLRKEQGLDMSSAMKQAWAEGRSQAVAA